MENSGEKLKTEHIETKVSPFVKFISILFVVIFFTTPIPSFLIDLDFNSLFHYNYILSCF